MFYDYTSLKLESFEAELINKNNKRDFLFGKFHTNFTCVRHVKHDETKRRQDNSYPNFNLKYLPALLGLGNL